MKIDGIDGDPESVKNYQYKGWSEIKSWTWGMTSNRKQINSSNNYEKNLNELSVIKEIGSDSPLIRLLFAKSKIIPKIEFSVIPSTGKREIQKYVHIHMEDIIIKSIVTGGESEDRYFKERITFMFDRIRFESGKPLSNNRGDNASQMNIFSWDTNQDTDWVN